MNIPFNRPYLSGNESKYILQAVNSGKISGDGIFTKRCHQFFENKYNFKKCLLTTSGTAALEMAAILLNIKYGDEIIMPSFTFVSTANAFVLRGATIIFADSLSDYPCIDADKIEKLITEKTKAIVVVHYAGIACDMDKIMIIAKKYNLKVVEDAAHSIDSFFKDKPLGSIGHLSAFSFHETKNVMCGEGGMLVINDKQYFSRAEIIREKGTNRTQFFNGETDKYNWVDIGSSYLPSDINAAFLFAQLENIESIQTKRKEIWNQYFELLNPLANKELIDLPQIPIFATNNAHLFYIICKNKEMRDRLIKHLAQENILAVFHYLPLHQSPFYKDKYNGEALLNTEKFANRIIRLPLYFELTEHQISIICKSIFDFFEQITQH
jgi:dTDP-4-amino-4,6-dideoxygalactose transaminase